MKKLLIIAAMMLITIGTQAQDKITAKVSDNNLDIALVNAVSYVAFQMDITLPTGVTATSVAASANRLNQTGSDTQIGGTKFIVSHNTLDGNVLRVIAYNLANAAIGGNSGDDVLNITLSAPVTTPSQVSVSNILFVKQSDLSESKFTNAVGQAGVLKGDVDGNGKVNTTDITEALELLFYDNDGSKNLYPQYNFSAADTNNDGKVNTTDITNIIEIIIR